MRPGAPTRLRLGAERAAVAETKKGAQNAAPRVARARGGTTYRPRRCATLPAACTRPRASTKPAPFRRREGERRGERSERRGSPLCSGKLALPSAASGAGARGKRRSRREAPAARQGESGWSGRRRERGGGRRRERGRRRGGNPALLVLVFPPRRRRATLWMRERGCGQAGWPAQSASTEGKGARGREVRRRRGREGRGSGRETEREEGK